MATHYIDRHRPASYSVSVVPGHSWTVTADSPFWYIQIMPHSSCQCVLNPSHENQSFPLTNGDIQILNGRDIDVKELRITNTASGASTATLDILVSYTGAAPTTATT